jgi:hypothetical protein
MEGGSRGGDQLFHLTIPATGVVAASGGGMPYPRVSYRSDCDDDGSEFGCWGGPRCVEAGDLWLAVDSDPGNEGIYSLMASFEECDAGEECVSRAGIGLCLPELAAEVEPNDDRDHAMPLDDVAGVEGTIDLVGDEDNYSIVLEAGQTIVVDTRGCDFDHHIFLFAEGDDPDGTPLALSDKLPCGRIEAVVPADGTYYIRVVGVGVYVGSYPMVVEVR